MSLDAQTLAGALLVVFGVVFVVVPLIVVFAVRVCKLEL